MTSIIRECEGGTYYCTCGNNDRGEGFRTCLRDGTEMEATTYSKWRGHYVCGRCGHIARASSIEKDQVTV